MVSTMVLGWLLTFCSCISLDMSCPTVSSFSPPSAPPAPLKAAPPADSLFSSSVRYQPRCSGVSGTLSTYSILGSSELST